MLSKSGTMTGGTSGGMEARSKQWDDKKVEGEFWIAVLSFEFWSGNFWCGLTVCCLGLKKKKEQFELELEELGSIREMQLKESETAGRLSGLDKKIQYADIEKVIARIYLYLFFFTPILQIR